MVQMGLALRDLPLAQVNFVQYPGTTGGTGVYEGKVEPTTYLADRLFAKIKADQSFSLGADSTGIGSETNPTKTNPTQPSPQQPTAAPSSPAAAPEPATPATPAAPSSAAPRTPSATPETIDGLEGQSADQQTCSKAFGY
jgi:hypothetical protein